MPAQLIAGDILQMRVWCSDTEQASVNTVYYKVLSITGDIDDLDAAVQFDTLIASSMKDFLNNNATYDGVQCRIWNRVPLPIAQSSTGGAGVGVGGAVALPRQTCGLISWKTEKAGPGYRGRWYMPFPAVSADVTDGKPSTGYVGSLVDFANLLITYTAIDAGGGSVAAVDMVLNSIVHAAQNKITNARGNDRWATQRRRGSYGRSNLSPIS